MAMRPDEGTDSETRFEGIARLYGHAGLRRLRAAHVCIVGLGGVGSWTVEALARSGVGILTLVDLDEVCESNINRQLHALQNTVGRRKVDVMAERVAGIAPDCDIRARGEFFTETTAEALLAERYDYLIDAIDPVANKCRLIAMCRERGLPILTCGAAGGRRDPARIQVRDLNSTSHDRLLQKVRDKLRKEHGFPRGVEPFGVEAVFSTEAPVFPQPDGSVCGDRSALIKSAREAVRLNCDWGLGSATFVTGAFGFAAAARAVLHLVEPAR